jgi:signal peptidase I
MSIQAEFNLLKDVLGKHQVVAQVIASGSMQPVIKTGETIRIRPLAYLGRDLKRFDIIVFKTETKIVCHYLHHINHINYSNKKFVTRSIAGHEDLPVSKDDILGYVENFKISWFLRLRLSLR